MRIIAFKNESIYKLVPMRLLFKAHGGVFEHCISCMEERSMAKKVVKVQKVEKKDIQVVNIVVSTSLEHAIPLEKMAATLSNTEYNPEQFPGLVIRIKEPKTSALIFSSGKVVCTGGRTMAEVKESIQQIIKSLEKIKVKITVTPQINIQNIDLGGDCDLHLDLFEAFDNLLDRFLDLCHGPAPCADHFSGGEDES